MVVRTKSRDERISLQLNPPIYRKIEKDELIYRNSPDELRRFIYECMRAEFVGPLSSDRDQCLECAFDIARRYSRALVIYEETQARRLPKGAHDPDEYADYFNEKQAEVKRHAEALLALLKDDHFPPAMSSVIGETRQGYLQPDGYPAFRTLERSLVERLDELAKSIKLPEAGIEQVTKQKGKRGEDVVRADCIRAVMHMWIEIGGADVRFQRKGFAGNDFDGKSCGPFNDFAVKVLEIFGIKHNDLETFVRKAEGLFKDIPDSHLERLRNQYRVTHQ